MAGLKGGFTEGLKAKVGFERELGEGRGRRSGFER